MDEVSLRDFVDREFQRIHERLDRDVASRKEALELATQALADRLDSMNEFRSQISEERANLLTRDIYFREHESLEKRVGDLETWKANIMGRAVAIGAVGAVAVALFGALAAHLLNGV